MHGVITGPAWEAEEDQLIIENYPVKGNVELTELLSKNKRTISAIRSRANKLGVKRRKAEKSKSSKNLIQVKPHIEIKNPPILKAFFQYVARAREVVLETGRKPNIDEMMKVFRDTYGGKREYERRRDDLRAVSHTG